jgi:hypothetical protein
LSGVAGAAACWTKQTAFTSILFVLLLVGFNALRRNSDQTATPLLQPIRAVGSSMLGAIWISIRTGSVDTISPAPRFLNCFLMAQLPQCRILLCFAALPA